MMFVTVSGLSFHEQNYLRPAAISTSVIWRELVHDSDQGILQSPSTVGILDRRDINVAACRAGISDSDGNCYPGEGRHKDCRQIRHSFGVRKAVRLAKSLGSMALGLARGGGGGGHRARHQQL